MFGLPTNCRLVGRLQADRTLTPIAPKDRSGHATPWVDVAIVQEVSGTLICELHLRFVAYRAGRDRLSSVRPLALVARFQAEVAPSAWRPLNDDSGADLRLEKASANPHVEVLEEAWFDRALRRLTVDEVPDAVFSVALVHRRGLSSHYACRVRTRIWLTDTPPPRVPAKPLLGIAIAQLQRDYEERFGAAFPVFGSVEEYVVVPDAKTGRGKVIRGYGRRSRVCRIEDVGSVYSALDVVAYGWDAHAIDPSQAETMAYATERLARGISNAAGSKLILLRVIDELEKVPNQLTEGEVASLRMLVDSSDVQHIPERLHRILRRSPRYPLPNPSIAHAVSASSTVLKLIRCVMPSDALTRFASAEEATAGDVRPVLNMALVRMVGEELGYLGKRRRPERPTGTPDTRLLHLVARLLAKRHHRKADTLLRTLVKPALTPPYMLSGFIVELDEKRARAK